MSSQHPDASQSSGYGQDGDASCRVSNIVPTGAIFAAALERLNRGSTVTLFQELVQELDKHCQALESRSADADGQLRGELLALLALLRQALEQHRNEAALVQQQLSEAKAQSAQINADCERNVIALLQRELKDIGVRLLQEAPKSVQRRSRLGIVLGALLAVLLAGMSFLAGLLWGRRAATVVCPAIPSAVYCTNAAGAQSSLAPAIVPYSGIGKNGVSAVESAVVQKPATAVSQTPAAPHAPSPQPGLMEQQMAEFLSQPAQKTPRMFVMDLLNYPPNSHEVNPEAKGQVYALAQILRAHPTMLIEIRGHNDGTESEVYTGTNPHGNYTLSQLRADCVLQRLQFLNVPLRQLRLRGFASTKPVADDTTAENRQRNRRVEIVVLHR